MLYDVTGSQINTQELEELIRQALEKEGVLFRENILREFKEEEVKEYFGLITVEEGEERYKEGYEDGSESGYQEGYEARGV